MRITLVEEKFNRMLKQSGFFLENGKILGISARSPSCVQLLLKVHNAPLPPIPFWASRLLRNKAVRRRCVHGAIKFQLDRFDATLQFRGLLKKNSVPTQVYNSLNIGIVIVLKLFVNISKNLSIFIFPVYEYLHMNTGNIEVYHTNRMMHKYDCSKIYSFCQIYLGLEYILQT